MKPILLTLFCFATVCCWSQNEFANKKFYDAFHQLYQEAGSGFRTFRGNKMSMTGSQREGEAAVDYTLNILLPQADSGLYVSLLTGESFILYFFKGGGSKQEAVKKERRLMEAIQTTYRKKLVRKSTDISIGNIAIVNTRYLAGSSGLQADTVVFQTSVVRRQSNFTIELKINSTQKPLIQRQSKLQMANNISPAIDTLLNGLTDKFIKIKGKLKEDGKWKKYETTLKLFGIAGEVYDKLYENGSLEPDVTYWYFPGDLKSVENATVIFQQLQKALEEKLKKITPKFIRKSESSDNEYELSYTDHESILYETYSIRLKIWVADIFSRVYFRVSIKN